MLEKSVPRCAAEEFDDALNLLLSLPLEPKATEDPAAEIAVVGIRFR